MIQRHGAHDVWINPPPVPLTTQEMDALYELPYTRLPHPRHPFSLEIISPDRSSIFVNLGPHPPRLWPEDIDLAHEMWLELSERFGARLHHRDVVGLALRRMKGALDSPGGRKQVIAEVEDELDHRAKTAVPADGHQDVESFEEGV